MRTGLIWSLLSALALVAGTRTIAAADPNQLSAAEKEAGWRLLFDGKTTEGWRNFGKPTFPAKGWLVEDGWLKCIAGARGGDIITKEKFTDFELEWDWRIPPLANNGVKYFAIEERKQAPGHEYQMIDDATPNLKPTQLTASFYDVLPPGPHKPVKLAPEINHSRVLVRGNHVEHWLNGEKVLDYECGSEQVKAAVAKSKFKNARGFGDKITGHILLTEHHDEAWFRNVKIRVPRGN
jgi:hypothetical protein